MEAAVGTERTPPPHLREPRQHTPQFMMEQREFQKAEANRERLEAAERRAVEEARKSAKRHFRNKAVAETKISQSSADGHMLSEEEVPTMAEVDSGMHGEELSEWMSQLFEKLDVEVNEDSICSTGKLAQVEAHPVDEDVISSKIHMPTKLKDTTMDHIGVSGSQWRSAADIYHFDKDEFLDHIAERLKKRGHVKDELSDLDKDAKDSHMSVKTISDKELLENGIKWMSEECFLAFTKSAERNCIKGIQHKFGELRSQCLNIEAHDKIFHHYNFTVEANDGCSDIWSSKLYFAEVKQLFGLKSYFCCVLEPTDCGWCHGCQNMKCELQHPSRGGYDEGSADMGWPFIDESDSGSDDDCGFGC